MADRPPHTMLGESIRDFSAEVDALAERLRQLDLPGSAADELGLHRAAQAVEEAHGRLVAAREELATSERELHELLEFERVRYRALFESAPDAYLVTSPDATIMEANKAAESLFGTTRDRLRGKPIFNLVVDEDRRAFRTMVWQLRSVQTITDWEVTLERRGGPPFPASVTVSGFRDTSGQIANLRWLVRDITERKQMEERTLRANVDLERRVAERTAELEALVHQIPGAIIVVDLSSNEVTPANDEARELLLAATGSDAPSFDRWLSIGVDRNGSPIPVVERPTRRAIDTGEPVVGGEVGFALQEGKTGLFEVAAAPLHDAGGKVTKVVATYWDVTERERRAQAERDFVTNAAHELRTPLAALASSVEVLQSGAKDDPAQRDRFLCHIEAHCARLKGLVHALLMLARAQAGQAAETEEIGVTALFDEVASEAPPDRVRFELEDGASVRANRDLAAQALRNLLVNAVKYAPEGEIVVKGRTSGDFVALEVVDRGPGIARRTQRRVLERFYRAVQTGDGFGLGLTIASQAAEAMRGRLEIDSEEGKGTTARLLLPAGDA